MPLTTIKTLNLGDLHLRFVAPADAPDKPGQRENPADYFQRVVHLLGQPHA